METQSGWGVLGMDLEILAPSFLVPVPNSNSEQSRALFSNERTEWGSSLYVTLKLISILHIAYGESQPDLPKLQSQSF